MTKIDQIQPGRIEAPRPQGKAGSTAGASFDDFLQKAVADTEEATTQAGRVTEVAQARPSAPVAAVSEVGQAHLETVAQAEDLLAVLDQYTGMLGGGVSLKRMSGLVEGMGAQAQALEQYAQSLPQGDELGDMARQISAQAQAEVLKFQRGDYNPV